MDLNNIVYDKECVHFIERSFREIVSEPMTISENTAKKIIFKNKDIEEYIIQRAENNLGEFK